MLFKTVVLNLFTLVDHFCLYESLKNPIKSHLFLVNGSGPFFYITCVESPKSESRTSKFEMEVCRPSLKTTTLKKAFESPSFTII